MENFHVDDELAAMIVNDENSDTATASLEGLAETGPEVGLINDGDGLLDISGLGHSNNYEDVSRWKLGMKGCNIPLPSERSRTRYCLKTGPNMV